ncbi:MAG: GNAT family N-acetyltransferase [Coprococcus sp.]
MVIRKGTQEDIDEVAALYDALTDYLEKHVNYPGWRKGIYPAREDAVSGIGEDNLFVAVENGRIAGTVILRHAPEEAYALADWHNQLEYKDIFVIYTFALHPDFLHQGLGKQMMSFIIDYAAHMNMKALRLDVYETNAPAIQLYEEFGFEYIDTVDLGYSAYGLNWFKLYQRLL